MTRILYWIIAILICAIAVISIAQARDDGRYAQSPFKEWFNSLTNKHNVPCCDTADGRRVDDADVEIEGNHYRVRIDGQWIDVPDDAVITAPNRAGVPIVWPYSQDGAIRIRCFIAGTLT